MNKLGFIGMGNMAKAIAAGIIKSGKISGADIYAYAPHQDKLRKNAEAIGFTACGSMEELLGAADTVVMACKPYQIEAVLEENRGALAGKALISIAAGWDYARYEPLVDERTRVQFIMPNTPAMVGEGVMLFEETNSLEAEERQELMDMFSALGLVEELGFPDHPCNPADLVKLLRNGTSISKIMAKSRPKSPRELLDACDLISCLEWSCINARRHELPEPVGMKTGVVREWHKALNWLTGHGQWDEVRTNS
mgnify:CR=1 FL=1